MDEYMITALEEARTGARGGRHPHRSSPGKRPGDGGRHWWQSPAAGRDLRHARGDQLPVERRPEAEQLPGG